MSALSSPRRCLSLFDEELNDLLRGVRIITKDLGQGRGNREQLGLWNKERIHEKGKCSMCCSDWLVVLSSNLMYVFFLYYYKLIKLTLREKVHCLRTKGVKQLSLHLSIMALQAGCYCPCFRSLRQLGVPVFHLLLNGILHHGRVPPPLLTGLNSHSGIRLYSWVERGTLRVHILPKNATQ